MRARTPSDEADRRLDPSAIAVWVAEGAGRAALPLVVLLFAGDRSGGVFVAVLVGLVVLGSVLRYLRFSYRLKDDALIVQGGVLQTWRRTIPFSRVQSVDVVQKLRHRAFGVVELRVEAAGGRETEGALVALRPEEAERIRSRLLARTGVPARPDTSMAPLAQLGPAMLLLAGVTGGRVAVVAVLLGYGQELVSEETASRFFERVEDPGGLLALLGIVAVFLAVSVVISIVATVLVHWGFTVMREGDRLVITRGLLERRRAIVPLGRLQAIRVDENLVRLAFGLASLTAITAGQARPSQEEQETNLLLPVAHRRQALSVASALLGADVEALVGGVDRPPTRALVPRLLAGAILGVAVAAIGLAVAGRAGWLAVLAVPVCLALAVASWRMLGTSIEPRYAVMRSGVLVRRTLLVPVVNRQHLSVTVSPVQRLLGLATLRVAIPRAVGRAVHLPRDRAAAGFALLSRPTSTDT